jgi:hypothetical protein
MNPFFAQIRKMGVVCAREKAKNFVTLRISLIRQHDQEDTDFFIHRDVRGDDRRGTATTVVQQERTRIRTDRVENACDG